MLHLFLMFACFVLTREQERRDYLGEILFLGVLCLCIKLNSLGLVAGIWAALHWDALAEKARAVCSSNGKWSS